MEIGDFIEARIGEDEAGAKAAIDELSSADGRWKSRGVWVDQPADIYRRVYDEDAQETVAAFEAVYPETAIGLGDAISAHIARHDPARVLRECATRRRILERHQVIDTGMHGRSCLRCAHCLRVGEMAWPCGDITDLAATWRDHPDWRQEWESDNDQPRSR